MREGGGWRLLWAIQCKRIEIEETRKNIYETAAEASQRQNNNQYNFLDFAIKRWTNVEEKYSAVTHSIANGIRCRWKYTRIIRYNHKMHTLNLLHAQYTKQNMLAVENMDEIFHLRPNDGYFGRTFWPEKKTDFPEQCIRTCIYTSAPVRMDT